MSPSKNTRVKPKGGHKSTGEKTKNICFVISPIGEAGTDRYTKFKDVFEYVIKTAVKTTGYDLQVLRADEIDRPGSFIKDILDNLYSSFVVIADLTEQNPNVFYELGVRHSLSSRTIMIAQNVDDIPSDLREYRTIVYENTAKGAAEFAKRLRRYLKEIYVEPNRPDNPVLDRIGGIKDGKYESLEAQNEELKQELEHILSKGTPIKPAKKGAEKVIVRIDRILKLKNANRQPSYGHFTQEGEKHFMLRGEQGDFKLFFLEDGKSIKEFWYLACHDSQFDYPGDLADIRVLMENCIQQGETACTFIIATLEDLSSVTKGITDIFEKMKAGLPAKFRALFRLELWDNGGLLAIEKKLGLKIEL